MVENLRKLKETYQRKTIINSREKQKIKSHTRREMRLIVASHVVWYGQNYIRPLPLVPGTGLSWTFFSNRSGFFLLFVTIPFKHT